jgi:hypothetical protein
MNDVTDKGRTLTPKQSVFAQLVSEGKSYTESYRTAYNSKNMSDQAIRIEGSKLAKIPHVASEIDRLTDGRKTSKKVQTKIHKSWITERLKAEALSDDNPASTRVRALELLGKSAGLFDESATLTIENRTPQDIEDELRNKLGAIFGHEA